MAAAARVIGNRILKSNRASVNYCRFFSSNTSDHRLNHRRISGTVESEKIREVQYEFEKLANDIGKKVDRLHDEVDILRGHMDAIIAHQRSEIEARYERVKIGLVINAVTIVGGALFITFY